jgi:hypothetical protein
MNLVVGRYATKLIPDSLSASCTITAYRFMDFPSVAKLSYYPNHSHTTNASKQDQCRIMQGNRLSERSRAMPELMPKRRAAAKVKPTPDE